jgi:hypothetical protein
MDATAAVLESWRNLYDGKAGLLTRAAVAGHRSVCRKTRRPRLLPVAMVVRAARPRRGREGVHHHESITNLGSPARNSTILRLSKLRTRKCGMFPHTAVLRSVPGGQRSSSAHHSLWRALCRLHHLRLHQRPLLRRHPAAQFVLRCHPRSLSGQHQVLRRLRAAPA